MTAVAPERSLSVVAAHDDPPLAYDLDAEAVLLSAPLSSPAAMDLLVGRVRAEDFWSNPHRRIWQAMLALHEAGKPIDTPSVYAELERAGRLREVGTQHAPVGELLFRLENCVPATTKLDTFVRVVRDKARMREARKVAEMIMRTAETHTGDAQPFLDRAAQRFGEIAQVDEMESLVRVKDAIAEKFERWQLAREGRTTNGLASGFDGIDARTGGLRAGTLTVLAARPGVGKSALALNIATNVAANGGGAVFFSLEMSRAELVDRQLAAESGIALGRVRDGLLDATDGWNRVTNAGATLQRLPFWIDDRAAIGALEIKAKCRRVDAEARKRGGALALVVVDYLQLMAEPDGSRSREQAVSANSRAMKALAKDLSVPVIALSQMNREADKGKREPRLSDLRESGAIEQDADMVWFIHRPDDATEAKLMVAKNRNGSLGDVPLVWRGELTRFESSERGAA